MKNISYLILLVLITSCVTTNTFKDDKSIIPLWFTDPGTYLSEEDNIIFKTSAKSTIIAERNIKEQSNYLSSYIEPSMIKSFTDDDEVVYLLYSINKEDLTNSMESNAKDLMEVYYNNISVADGTSDILEKYTLYINSMDDLNSLVSIIELGEKENLILNITYDTDRELLQEKINQVKNQIVFRVDVIGDIDNQLKDRISKELHKMGYEESEYGLISIEANLSVKNVDLDNDYINKYWSLTVSLKDYNGTTKDSLNFKGRESKLDNESVNQLIITLASKSISESLNSILP